VPARKRGKDLLTKERRSWNMSRIRGKDTTPEKIVRSLLHRLGYRFRLNRRIPVPASTLNSQPSIIHVRPDIVLAKQRAAIFVHGCFGTDMKDVRTARLRRIGANGGWRN
jgi:DNA mismatch endonuclease (patch repair protein)